MKNFNLTDKKFLESRLDKERKDAENARSLADKEIQLFNAYEDYRFDCWRLYNTPPTKRVWN